MSPLRLGALIAALALIIFAGYTGVKYTMAYLFPDSWESGEEDVDDGLPADQMNLLLLGIDAREGESIARADSIIFVHADTGAQKLALMSIPRDTRVEIPRRGMDKINSATVYGGPEMAREVVSDLLGVPVPYHMMVDFEGFKGIVDILGGVTIDVEKRMYYRDRRDTPPLLIDLQPGVQRLNADEAMGYVRYRGDALADIARTQRQQKFLMALANEMMKPKTILKLPKLVPELRKNVDTNLSLRNMVKWAGMARKLDKLEMVSGTLPGMFWDSRGVSYWYVDPAKAKVAFADLVAGNPIADPVDPQTSTPAPVVTPRPQAPPPPPPVEAEPEDPAPGEPGGGEGAGTTPPGEGAPPRDPPGDTGEPPVGEEPPGWIPVDANPTVITDGGRGPDHNRIHGAGTEYGARPAEDTTAGG